MSRSKMPRTYDVRVSITKMCQMDTRQITASCYGVVLTHLFVHAHGQFERSVAEGYEM